MSPSKFFGRSDEARLPNGKKVHDGLEGKKLSTKKEFDVLVAILESGSRRDKFAPLKQKPQPPGQCVHGSTLATGNPGLISPGPENEIELKKKIVAFQQQVNKLTGSLQASTTKYELANQRVKDLETEIGQLKQVQAENKTLIKRNSSLEKKLVQLQEASNGEEKQEVKNLKGRLTKATSLKEEAEASLETCRSRLKSLEDEKKQFQTSVQDFKQTIKSLNEQKKTDSKRVEELNEELKKLRELQIHSSTCTQDLTASQKQVERIQKKHDKTVQERDDLVLKHGKTVEERNGLETKVKEMEEKLKHATKRAKKLETQLGEVREATVSSETRRKELKRKLQETTKFSTGNTSSDMGSMFSGMASVLAAVKPTAPEPPQKRFDPRVCRNDEDLYETLGTPGRNI